jgi:hypothetical protein
MLSKSIIHIDTCIDGQNPAVSTRCQFCLAKRRLPIQPHKQLFSEHPENVVEEPDEANPKT